MIARFNRALKRNMTVPADAKGRCEYIVRNTETGRCYFIQSDDELTDFIKFVAPTTNDCVVSERRTIGRYDIVIEEYIPSKMVYSPAHGMMIDESVQNNKRDPKLILGLV